ncbi:hypothetical protein EDC01DRAFT_22911 [Geopyxis carbonaria]|nr:hypothetical protein EDC01DRAFT_22911 [Geopyxis carbonaria]
MGLFGSSKSKKDKKELKEARQQLKQLDKRKQHKMMSSSSVDPAKALNEAQPWQVNQEKTTQSLSTLAHKDVWGNPIKEPDLTNPTRSRWERPLDTIRGFHDSIDRGYRRSYYGGVGEEQGAPINPPESHPNWGPNSRAHSRHVDGSSDGHYTHQPNRMAGGATPLSASSEEAQGFGVGAMNGRNGINEQMVMNNRARNYSNGSTNGGYPDTGYGSVDHGSRGGSSGNLEQDMMYGHGNVNSGPPPQNVASPLHQMSSPHPPPPPQDKPKNVIRLSSGTGGATPTPQQPTQQEEKRKSWLGRRFSRN